MGVRTGSTQRPGCNNGHESLGLYESDEIQGWAEVSSGSTAMTSGPVETALSLPLWPDLTSGSSTLWPSTPGLTLLQGSSPSVSL